MDRPIKTLDSSTPPIYGTSPPIASLMNGSGCVFDHYGRIPEDIYKVDTFNSPLEEAVCNNDVAHFRELVEEGHKVTVKLRLGEMTCIEFCGMMGQTEMLQALIESSVNTKILHDYFSLDDVVDRAYMISKNKPVFFGQGALAEANRYEAALFTAVEYNQPDCVRLMLAYLGAREPGRHAFLIEENEQKQLTASELAEIRVKFYMKEIDGGRALSEDFYTQSNKKMERNKGHVKCSEILKKHLADQVVNS